MKVRFNVHMPEKHYVAGDVQEIADDEAKGLIAAGYATAHVEATEPPGGAHVPVEEAGTEPNADQ